jgi:hypothetical protein
MKILPSAVPSLIGPVEVIQSTETNRLLDRAGECGNFRMDAREIRVHGKMPAAMQWQTLGHEMMHVILEDSGMKYVLEENHQEAVADAFGTWFANAIASGKIVLR